MLFPAFIYEVKLIIFKGNGINIKWGKREVCRKEMRRKKLLREFAVL
jgi:hypothetical protein